MRTAEDWVKEILAWTDEGAPAGQRLAALKRFEALLAGTIRRIQAEAKRETLTAAAQVFEQSLDATWSREEIVARLKNMARDTEHAG